MTDKQANIVFILLRPLVAHAEAKLKRWAYATHLPRSDRAGRVQFFARIATPRPSARGELLPAIAPCIEEKRMEINLPSVLTSKHKPRGKARLTLRVVSEAVFSQGSLRAFDSLAVDSKI